jgi:hypothetical protein
MKRLVDSLDLDNLKKTLEEEGCRVPENLEDELEKYLRILSWRLKPGRQEADVGFENMATMSKAVRSLFQTDVYRHKGWFLNEGRGAVRLWSPEFFSPSQRALDDPLPPTLKKACPLMRRKRKGLVFNPRRVLGEIPRTLSRKSGPERYVFFFRQKTTTGTDEAAFQLTNKAVEKSIRTTVFADHLLLLKDSETAQATYLKVLGGHRMFVWNEYVSILFSEKD